MAEGQCSPIPITGSTSAPPSRSLATKSGILARLHAEALFVVTPQDLFAGEEKPRKMRGASADRMAKMEREMGNLQGQVKLVEKSEMSASASLFTTYPVWLKLLTSVFCGHF